MSGTLRRLARACAPFALAICVTACGQAAGAPDRLAPAVVAGGPPTMYVPVVGGSAAQRVLLRRIMTSVRPSEITGVTIRPPDRGWHPFRPGDVMLAIAIHGSPNPRHENLLAEWQGWVVAGAFRDRSAETGLPRVIALDESIEGRFSGGMRIALVHSGVQSHATRSQAGTLRTQLRRIVRRSGARLVRLRVARPDGLAATVIVETDRPAWYLHHRMPTVLRETAGRFHDDGLAWAVDDRAGRRVFQMANASRLGTGAEGTIPSLAGCNPFGPGDAIAVNGGTHTPKCPGASVGRG